MKNLFALILCVGLTSGVFSNKAKADPAIASVIAAVTTAGAGTFMVWLALEVTEDVTEATFDSTSQFKRQYVQAVKDDAMEYLASNGEYTTPLLENLIEESYVQYAALEDNVEELEREMIIKALVKDLDASSI